MFLLVFVNALFLLVGAVMVAYLLRGRDGTEGTDGDAWRDGAVDLAREVKHTASTVDRPADPDQVARRLLPLSGRIHGHVRAAPAGIEQEIYRALFELGVECNRVAIEQRPKIAPPEGQFLEDRLETLEGMAGGLESTIADGSSDPDPNSEQAR